MVLSIRTCSFNTRTYAGKGLDMILRDHPLVWSYHPPRRIGVASPNPPYPVSTIHLTSVCNLDVASPHPPYPVSTIHLTSVCMCVCMYCTCLCVCLTYATLYAHCSLMWEWFFFQMVSMHNTMRKMHDKRSIKVCVCQHCCIFDDNDRLTVSLTSDCESWREGRKWLYTNMCLPMQHCVPDDNNRLRAGEGETVYGGVLYRKLVMEHVSTHATLLTI